MSKPTYRIADTLRQKAGQYELTIFCPAAELKGDLARPGPGGSRRRCGGNGYPAAGGCAMGVEGYNWVWFDISSWELWAAQPAHLRSIHPKPCHAKVRPECGGCWVTGSPTAMHTTAGTGAKLRPSHSRK